MTNRPFWSSIWPASLARDKKNVLNESGFEYDYSGNAFVHREQRKIASFDAVSDMKLDDLNAFAAKRNLSAKVDCRFRGELAVGRLEVLMERYGWA